MRQKKSLSQTEPLANLSVPNPAVVDMSLADNELVIPDRRKTEITISKLAAEHLTLPLSEQRQEHFDAYDEMVMQAAEQARLDAIKRKNQVK